MGAATMVITTAFEQVKSLANFLYVQKMLLQSRHQSLEILMNLEARLLSE